MHDFINCDVSNNDEMRSVINKIHKKYIDLFCSNAGIARDDDGLASVKHWDQYLEN